MRVISKSRLKQFWQAPGHADSEGPLRAWYTHVNSKTINWHSWGDVKASFATASLVGNCVIFNVGGNKYRLVTRVLYASQKVFILRMMTHAQYDNEPWQDDCGCFQPPPKSSKPRHELSPIKRKRR